MMVQEIAHQAEHAATEAKFDAGKTIIEHVSNAREHPILHLPTMFGIDFSISKHVMMLWLIAVFVFIVVTLAVRRYLKQEQLVPHGLAWPIYILLIPIEVMGMFVRPFALTMRLAANMTGGHIAILTLLSLVFIFTEMSGRALVGIGFGAVVSVPLAAAISGLE